MHDEHIVDIAVEAVLEVIKGQIDHSAIFSMDLSILYMHLIFF